jgi:hypothetical protein
MALLRERFFGVKEIGKECGITRFNIIPAKYIAYNVRFWYDKHRLLINALPAPF